MELQQLIVRDKIKTGFLTAGLLYGLVGMSISQAVPAVAAQNQLTQLDNHPDLEGHQHFSNNSSNNSTTKSTITTQSPLFNPWLALIPLALLLAAVWWLIRRTNRPTWQRDYSQYPFTIAGAKGGETERYRNDNDVYVEKLRDQERRLREFYDNEPLTDSKPDQS